LGLDISKITGEPCSGQSTRLTLAEVESREHLDDMPEIRDWAWSATGGTV